MDEQLPGRGYLLGFAVTIAVVLVVVALSNWLIDPYSLFGMPRYAGINALRPASAERSRVMKPYLAERAEPVTVIAGNSRPEMGLDPQSACWQAGEQPVFNTAVPGAGVAMQIAYLEHALTAGAGRRAVLGLDLADFLVSGPRPKDTGALTDNLLRLRLADRDIAPLGQWLQRAEDRLTGLFSLTTLTDSLYTVLAQGNPQSSTRRADGFNPARDYIAIIRNEGQAVLFSQKNREVVARFRQPGLGLRYEDGSLSKEFQELETLLGWAKEAGLELTLFINPYHVDYLLSVALTGNWPALEEWKRQLLTIATDYQVPLWDFHSLDGYSTENPSAKRRMDAAMEWFWEPAHYRRALGELMLAAMLDRDCAPAGEQASFGLRLSLEGIDAHLQILRVAIQAEQRRNAAAMERLRPLLADDPATSGG